MSSYVYILSESGPDHRLYTVGFYKPDGKFEPESDHSDSEAAARRVAWLNGGGQAVEHSGEPDTDIARRLRDYNLPGSRGRG